MRVVREHNSITFSMDENSTWNFIEQSMAGIVGIISGQVLKIGWAEYEVALGDNP